MGDMLVMGPSWLGVEMSSYPQKNRLIETILLNTHNKFCLRNYYHFIQLKYDQKESSLHFYTHHQTKNREYFYDQKFINLYIAQSG